MEDINKDQVIEIQDKINEVVKPLGLDFSCVLVSENKNISIVSNVSKADSIFLLIEAANVFNKTGN